MTTNGKNNIIKFTLDGQDVEAPEGETIFRTARRYGIKLPHLCYSPKPGYRPDGNCRVCMVEIEGERVLAASCIRTPAPGMKVNTQTDRAHCHPWGLGGGLDATGNQVHFRIDGQWKTDQPNAKTLITHLKPGDAIRLRSGGGGGFGDPLARAIATVISDVRQGYVSVEAAAKLYAVIIDPQTLAVDAAATERLRRARREQAATPKTASS